MEAKICTKCHVEKPISEFYVRRDRGSDSVRPQCKECTRTQLALLPKASYSQMSIEQKAGTARRQRKHLLKKLYGLTPAEYEAMLESQGGRCAVCRSDKVGGKHRTNTMIVDHDHKTGKVRGLLCNHCNMMIGMMERSLEVSQLALDYLHTTTAP